MSGRTEAVACALQGDDLVERVQAWMAVASQGLDRRAEPGRIVSTYPRDRELLARIEQLIAAEAECCPFLKFRIEEQPDEMIVELQLPEELTPAFAALLQAVTEGGGRSSASA